MDSETHVMLETFLYNEVNESNEVIIFFETAFLQIELKIWL